MNHIVASLDENVGVFTNAYKFCGLVLDITDKNSRNNYNLRHAQRNCPVVTSFVIREDEHKVNQFADYSNSSLLLQMLDLSPKRLMGTL